MQDLPEIRMLLLLCRAGGYAQYIYSGALISSYNDFTHKNRQSPLLRDSSQVRRFSLPYLLILSYLPKVATVDTLPRRFAEGIPTAISFDRRQ